ncbi:MAG: MBL fold metallo-hydrolase [Succinivibrio sp.]
MKIQHIRHDSEIIDYGSIKFITNPMFGPLEENTFDKSIELIKTAADHVYELPITFNQILEVDLILFTNLSFEHFDRTAQSIIPKDKCLLVQNDLDKLRLESLGFTNVLTISDGFTFKNVVFHKITAVGVNKLSKKKLMHGSGYILTAPKEKTLYITGDTIFSSYVKDALLRYHPDVVVAHCGGLNVSGDQIKMGAEGILSIHKTTPDATIVAIHHDPLNSEKLSKNKFIKMLHDLGMDNQIVVPVSGTCILAA